MMSGEWKKKWRLMSSNQRELAAIILGLQSLEPNLGNGRINSLRIESDNSTAIFDINRGAAAPAIAKLVDSILQKAE
jgi:ribonuclease HI